MYYSELIHKFWKFNEKINIGATAIAMYLYLLKLAKDADGYSITASDVAVGRALGVTRKTVKAIKQKLNKLGLIEYGTKNGTSGSYRIIVDYPFREAGVGCGKETEREKFSRDKKPEEETALTPYHQKQKRNDKDSNRNLNSSEGELPQTSTPNIGHQSRIPTLDEFLEYAQTLDAFVPPLHSELIQKYSFWKGNGWKNNSNRPITNWRLALKQLLPYMRENANQELNAILPIPDIKVPEELGHN